MLQRWPVWRCGSLPVARWSTVGMGSDHRDDGGRRLLAGAHEIERRLADELKSGVKPSDPSVVQARAKLRDLFRELLLEHYELAVRKGVERSLWLIVFHRRIEEHRKKLRRASEAEQAAVQRPESVPESVRVSANASGQRARPGAPGLRAKRRSPSGSARCCSSWG